MTESHKILGHDDWKIILCQLVLKSTGYGILVKCCCTTDDFTMLSIRKRVYKNTLVGYYHVKLWLFLNFMIGRIITQSTDMYIQYLETGWIQKQALQIQVQPYLELCLGALIAIQKYNNDRSCTWSKNMIIMILRVHSDEKYTIIAHINNSIIAFNTKLLLQQLSIRLVNI